MFLDIHKCERSCYMIKSHKKISSFKPIIDKNTRVFIVGTMPSVQSLIDGEYYAHPRNHFWQIMTILFHKGLPFKSFDEKKACLLKNKIGLWDALETCQRQGSLDSNIKNETPHDFKKYPQIRYYLFNGQKAYAFFKKYNNILLSDDNYFILPSTSPANASYTYDKKLSLWQEAFNKANQL